MSRDVRRPLPGGGTALTRRQFLAGAAAAGAGALLSGCGADGLAVGREPQVTGGREYDGPRVELSYWNGFTGGDGPLMAELVQRFNREHPLIRITMNSIRWDEYYRKVPVAVASGKGPDLGVMQQHHLPSNAARGVVIPLDELADSFGLQGRDFAANAWQGAVYRGKRYGIPLDVHPLGMYYNKGAFEKAGIEAPPATREEFDEALAKLKESGFANPFWIPTQWPAHFMFESLLWQFGGSPFAPDGSRVTFASDAGRQAIDWMTSMYRRGYSPAAVALDAQFNAFLNGTNAIAWDGIWMVLAVADVPGGAGVAPLPQIGEQKAAWGNSHSLVIFNRPELDPRRVQAAMVFVEWLTAHTLDWAKAGQIPARNSVRQSKEFRELEGQGAFAEQLPYVRLVPVGPGIGDIQDQTVLSSVDSALRSADPAATLREQQRLADDQLQIARDQYRR